MSAARLIFAVKAMWAWLAGIAALRIIVRAVDRMMAREVMLFAGGAGFFGLLALFPAVLVGVSIYGLLFSPENAVAQMTQLELAGVLPPSANNFLNAQLYGLANASRVSLTFQGAIAFGIAVFASARGALLLTANLIILTVPNLIRPALRMLGSEAADAAAGMINEWTVGGLAMAMALSLLYRFIMQRAGETSWRASLIGAGIATAIWLAASKGFTLYVSAVIDPNIYGPLGALIVFLLWVYWTSYVMFFGGALAVEIDRYRERLPEQLEAGNS